MHDDEGQEGHAAGDADQAESQRYRWLWFGQDPVRSITVTAVPLDA